MDPITHGITGSLLGKGFFKERHGRIATFALTLGAMFPDVDVVPSIVAEWITKDPLEPIKVHRGFTHSFLALPVFAVALGWLTRWYCSRRGWKGPSFGVLTLMYAIGIASHILLDAMTSYGTRLWSPISSERVSWDILFIIDFSFTAIVLLPQVAARVFRERAMAKQRAVSMWFLFTAVALAAWGVAWGFGYPFQLAVVAVIAVLLAVLFFAPLKGGWGFSISEVRWNRWGTAAMFVYIAACGVAHHAALESARAYASERNLNVVRMAAIPSPPSFLNWSAKILTPEGVYQSRFDLRSANSPVFQFLADSPRDEYVARAMELPDVSVYLWFARFPVIHSREEAGAHVVEFGDSRFTDQGRRMPVPFRFRVVFDSAGNLVEEDWAEGVSGIRLRRLLGRDAASPKQ